MIAIPRMREDAAAVAGLQPDLALDFGRQEGKKVECEVRSRRRLGWCRFASSAMACNYVGRRHGRQHCFDGSEGCDALVRCRAFDRSELRLYAEARILQVVSTGAEQDVRVS